MKTFEPYAIQIKKNEAPKIMSILFGETKPDHAYTALVIDIRTRKIAAGFDGDTRRDARAGAVKWIRKNQ